MHIEQRLVHARNVPGLVPLDSRMVVPRSDIDAANLVLLEQLEERLVAAIGQASKLIVVPLLSHDALCVDHVLASKGSFGVLAALLAYVDA